MSTNEIAYDRNATIKVIKAALKARSGKVWSVTGGRGTSWGWIRISSPPARCLPGGTRMTPEDAQELATLLNETQVFDYVSIPSGGDYRLEYIARAKGETPTVYGVPYWD